MHVCIQIDLLFSRAPDMKTITKAALGFSLLSLGCGSDGTSSVNTNTPATQTATNIVMSGPSTVEVGKSITITAYARASGGGAIPGKVLLWISSNESVARVSQDGVVTGAAGGTSSISASADGKTFALTITVTIPAAVVASVTVTGSATPQVGSTVQYTAVAKDANGIPVTVVPVWSTSDSTTARVRDQGTVDLLRLGNRRSPRQWVE